MLICLLSPVQILHARAKLNDLITSSIQDACEAWGMVVKRYEITEISPDKQISAAMDRQAAAERIRRERVLTAEGNKRAMSLEAEGEAAAGEKKMPPIVVRISMYHHIHRMYTCGFCTYSISTV